MTLSSSRSCLTPAGVMVTMLRRLCPGSTDRTPGPSRIIGSRLATLYVAGRKSGRRYPVPVSYLAHGDDLLIGTSSGWARNLREGEPVAIRFKAKTRLAD